MTCDRLFRACGIMLGVALALFQIGSAAAQPMLCGDPATIRTGEHPGVAAGTLVGTFRCSGEGLTITLRLGADGRFEQSFDAESAAFGEAERREFAEAGRTGRWRLEGDTLHLFERPTRAPTIVLVEQARDPSVRMRVEVREADGRPARGVFVGEGADANPQSQLEDGVLIVPKSYDWTPGLRRIVRQGDDLPLASFTATRDGANVFRYVYRPSEVEPFDIRARVMDPGGDAIGVPLGIGGALLRRVPPGD
jgi:hypothetical protein